MKIIGSGFGPNGMAQTLRALAHCGRTTGTIEAELSTLLEADDRASLMDLPT